MIFRPSDRPRPEPLNFLLEDHGTVWLIHPLTERASTWLHDTAPEESMFFGGALCVEWRYVPGVLCAIAEATAEAPAEVL